VSIALCFAPVGAQVRYQATFDATWSEQTHPTEFPTNPHFSPLVGGLHNENVMFWEVGGLASDGMETMAETGATSTLVSEIQTAAAQGDASGSTIVGSSFASPGVSVVQFDVNREFSRLTLVSMLAPSPDWFVGVAGLPLFENGHWREQVTVVLFTYDAGSDSGTTFLSANDDTVPPEPIVKIATAPLADDTGYQPPVGTYTLSILSVDGLPPHEDFDGDGLDNLRENELGTDPQLSDTDGDGHTDPFDNCPIVSNPLQDDGDGDRCGDACDNCRLDWNPSQSDADRDNQGDICDLDDGVIYIRFHEPEYVEWQEEFGYTQWNCYRGDLALLRTVGVYTQDPGTVPLATKYCGLNVPSVLDPDPTPGGTVFFLTTGTSLESSLGTDSEGVERPNSNPCP